MTTEFLTTFFGWMAVVNIGFLMFTTVMLFALRDWATGIHARMFDMDPADIRKAYFRYLANYKTLTLIFAVAPWLALKLA